MSLDVNVKLQNQKSQHPFPKWAEHFDWMAKLEQSMQKELDAKKQENNGVSADSALGLFSQYQK